MSKTADLPAVIVDDQRLAGQRRMTNRGSTMP
jgi:hypothetical protein